MKKLILIIVAGCFIAACNNESTEKPKDEKMDKKDETASSNITYPYKASYSSDFKMGDAQNSKLVLDFFKGWEDGTMTGWKDMVADSVWINFADGQHFMLSRDSMMSMAKTFRSMSSNVKLDVEAFMPIHLNDRNEDYVLVWEKDYSTDKKTNKVDSSGVHSFWQIKNNKIIGWQEYNRKLAAPPMKK
jgi:ketosteroid isomerase-like protein